MKDAQYEYVVTVLTPTYNRRQTLASLYKSLCEQTEQNFQWLIIDDGSTDGTEEYIKTLATTGFSLEYYKKDNGGKHTALNYVHPYIKGEVVVIVDSDDYLLSHSIATIESDWNEYKNRTDICGMSYLKGKANGTHLSQKSPESHYVDDDIHYRVNGRISGDRCEVLRTELLRKYPLPVFQGEPFMSEGWLWNTLAKSYKTVYRNEIIYICEYLDGGLTASGRALRMRCPLGMMENCRAFFCREVNPTVQIKEMILYWVYGKCAGYGFSKIIKSSGKKSMALVAPFGVLLYIYWKYKYKL